MCLSKNCLFVFFVCVCVCLDTADCLMQGFSMVYGVSIFLSVLSVILFYIPMPFLNKYAIGSSLKVTKILHPRNPEVYTF